MVSVINQLNQVLIYLKKLRMKFEWDEQKAKSNLSKHGISFEEAQTVEL
jgi:hypothetical protein